MEKGAIQVCDRADVAWHAPVHAAVQRVPDDGMANRAEVDADLMRAAGVNRHLHQRQHPAEVLGADDARHRGPGAAYPRRLGRHLLAVRRIAADRRVDPAAGHHFAPGEREIFLLHLTLGELPRQLFVRPIVLRDDHQARRALVQPVHDAGPLFSADAAEIVHVVQQGVDQGAALVARRRVDHHARRLVDDDQILVLVDDRERQILGRGRRLDRLGNLDRDLLSGLDRLVRLRRVSCDQHGALLDQPLKLRPRQRERRGEKSIEPEIVGVDRNGERLYGHGAPGPSGPGMFRRPSSRAWARVSWRARDRPAWRSPAARARSK